MKSPLPILATALLFAIPAAAQTIDVNQPLVDSDCLTATHSLVAQSFIPTASTCAGAGVLVTDNLGWFGTANLTIALYDVDPYSAGATPLASSTVVATNGSGAWVDAFWPAVAVTPGQTYWIEYWEPGITSICFQGNLGFDAYTGGEFYYQGAPFVVPGWDLAFRTYSDGTAGPTYSIQNLVAGQVANFVVNGATAGGTVMLGYSLLGPGPTATPYGSVDMTAPINTLATLTADINGDAAFSPVVPGGVAGVTLYTQGLDLASGTLTNSLAELVL